MDFEIVTVVDNDNPNIGDLKLTDGQITLTTDLKTSVAQHITIRLRTFFGEWFLDDREGIPYFDLILVKNPDVGQITSVFRSTILGTPGVTSIARLSLDLDRVSRTLSISQLEITLEDGAVLIGADFGALLLNPGT